MLNERREKTEKKAIQFLAVVVLIAVIIVAILVVIYAISNETKQNQYCISTEHICQKQPSLENFKNQNRISVNIFVFRFHGVRRNNIVQEFKSIIFTVCYFYCFFLAWFLPVWHDLIKLHPVNQKNMM